MRPSALALFALLSGCSHGAPFTVRYAKAAELRPAGEAPGVRHRLVAAAADGTRTFVVVLAAGDEVITGLTAVATREGITDARITGIGNVRDPEVAWFDADEKAFRVMRLAESTEVLSLIGGVALGKDGAPVVHVHATLGREDGDAWGGHLVRATVSPNLEVYLTAYPEPLHKKDDPDTDTQRIDL